jgi:hypothetical protein
MGHYDIDIHCSDCGRYCYSVYYTSDLPEKGSKVYCRECQKKHDTPQEHFVRNVKTLR